MIIWVFWWRRRKAVRRGSARDTHSLGSMWLMSFSQEMPSLHALQTRDVDPMLAYCWPTVCDIGWHWLFCVFVVFTFLLSSDNVVIMQVHLMRRLPNNNPTLALQIVFIQFCFNTVSPSMSLVQHQSNTGWTDRVYCLAMSGQCRRWWTKSKPTLCLRLCWWAWSA